MTINYQYYPEVTPPLTGIIRLPDHANIPEDPENKDWIAFQEWLAEGNTPLPPS